VTLGIFVECKNIPVLLSLGLVNFITENWTFLRTLGLGLEPVLEWSSATGEEYEFGFDKVEDEPVAAVYIDGELLAAVTYDYLSVAASGEWFGPRAHAEAEE
jgi:hypothetical protein